MTSPDKAALSLRVKLNQIIFSADTRAGRLFDLYIICFIGLSVLAALLDSVASINVQFHGWLYALELVFTVLFTGEYALRLYSAESSRR